jgi:pimeloyl-ACP methyl ester carboxylesterase
MINKLIAGFGGALSGIAILLANDTQGFVRVDANGAKLRMQIMGRGSPTVVFENGGGGSIEWWGQVPARVSGFAKVVAYDRAGDGLSGKPISERDGRKIASELHAALQNANLPPPYVLAGHSLGGAYARIFAGMYPKEVAGLVLVDPTQEGMVEWNIQNGFSRAVDTAGFRHVTFSQARESAVPAGIPVHLIHVARPWPHAPFPSKYVDEMAARVESRLHLALQFHKDWLEGIPGSRLIITDVSSHAGINFEQPELVVGSIRAVVDAGRNR